MFKGTTWNLKVGGRNMYWGRTKACWRTERHGSLCLKHTMFFQWLSHIETGCVVKCHILLVISHIETVNDSFSSTSDILYSRQAHSSSCLLLWYRAVITNRWTVSLRLQQSACDPPAPPPTSWKTSWWCLIWLLFNKNRISVKCRLAYYAQCVPCAADL